MMLSVVLLAQWGKPISYGVYITCHMRSHSVTCRPTQLNAYRLNLSHFTGTRFTDPGGMEG